MNAPEQAQRYIDELIEDLTIEFTVDVMTEKEYIAKLEEENTRYCKLLCDANNIIQKNKKKRWYNIFKKGR